MNGVKVVAAVVFGAGLLLGVRVMFFGVQRRHGTEQVSSRVWPFALAVFFMITGAAIYLRFRTLGTLELAWPVGVVVLALVIASAAWWLVRRSALAPSTDPEDDPRYRFQGHVARIVKPISGAGEPGLVAFDFDGQRQEFSAKWTAEALSGNACAEINDDVVIERVEGDVAFVEPWAMVEQRL
jgi:membrane protein implicated in regulation of membrane protease activity